MNCVSSQGPVDWASDLSYPQFGGERNVGECGGRTERMWRRCGTTCVAVAGLQSERVRPVENTLEAIIESIITCLGLLVSDENLIDHYEIRYRGIDDRSWHHLDSLDAETELVPESETPLTKEWIEPASL